MSKKYFAYPPEVENQLQALIDCYLQAVTDQDCIPLDVFEFNQRLVAVQAALTSWMLVTEAAIDELQEEMKDLKTWGRPEGLGAFFRELDWRVERCEVTLGLNPQQQNSGRVPQTGYCVSCQQNMIVVHQVGGSKMLWRCETCGACVEA
jgi:hypothetical protein